MNIVGVLTESDEGRTHFLCGSNWQHAKHLLVVQTPVNCQTVDKYFVDDEDLQTMKEAIQETPVIFELSALFKTANKQEYAENFLPQVFTKALEGGEHLFLLYSTEMQDFFWENSTGIVDVISSCSKLKEGWISVHSISKETTISKIFDVRGTFDSLFDIAKFQLADNLREYPRNGAIFDIKVGCSRLCFFFLPPAVPSDNFLDQISISVTEWLNAPVTSNLFYDVLPRVKSCTLFMYLQPLEKHLSSITRFIEVMCNFAKSNQKFTIPGLLAKQRLNKPDGLRQNTLPNVRVATPPSRVSKNSRFVAEQAARQEQTNFLQMRELERENLELRTAQERSIKNFAIAEAALNTARKEIEELRTQISIAEKHFQSIERSREKRLWRERSLKKKFSDLKKSEQVLREQHLSSSELRVKLDTATEELRKEKELSVKSKGHLQCLEIELTETRKSLLNFSQTSEELKICKQALKLSEEKLHNFQKEVEDRCQNIEQKWAIKLQLQEEESSKAMWSLKEVTSQMDQLKLALAKMGEKNSNLLSKTVELKQTRRELERKEAELEQGACALESAAIRIHQLENTFELVGEDFSNLQAENSTYKQEISRLIEKVALSQEEVKMSNRLLHEKNGQIELLHLALSEAREASQKIISLKEESLSSMSTKLESTIREIAALGSERENLRSELGREVALRLSLEQKLVKAKQKRGELKRSLHKTVDQLSTTRQDLFAASLSMKCYQQGREVTEESQTVNSKKLGMLSDLRGLISTYKSITKPNFTA